MIWELTTADTAQVCHVVGTSEGHYCGTDAKASSTEGSVGHGEHRLLKPVQPGDTHNLSLSTPLDPLQTT